MINIDLITVADLRHDLRVFMGACLLLSLVIPYVAYVWDGIRGKLD